MRGGACRSLGQHTEYNATRRAVCLLRSRRRTVLLSDTLDLDILSTWVRGATVVTLNLCFVDVSALDEALMSKAPRSACTGSYGMLHTHEQCTETETLMVHPRGSMEFRESSLILQTLHWRSETTETRRISQVSSMYTCYQVKRVLYVSANSESDSWSMAKCTTVVKSMTTPSERYQSDMNQAFALTEPSTPSKLLVAGT